MDERRRISSAAVRLATVGAVDLRHSTGDNHTADAVSTVTLLPRERANDADAHHPYPGSRSYHGRRSQRSVHLVLNGPLLSHQSVKRYCDPLNKLMHPDPCGFRSPHGPMPHLLLKCR
ncbi:hypothetical protein AVEN_264431-1 [Araneus ventricosus]|uniref:Uncharacterized protein n=1 Tax=Araneus ventricosus TaxID=182803 RepID=A0A4Y2VPA7_ARAVE|nr:hypothetical protein AVEN_264431-1 [Araneus ventricosus]